MTVVQPTTKPASTREERAPGPRVDDRLAAEPVPANSVLLVDDEAAIRRIVAGVLRDDGCEVHEAASGEAALERIEHEPPAVAVIDLVLPGMDGIELMLRIKRRSPETEIVVVTGHATVDTAVAALRCGARDYVQKPFDDIAELSRIVRAALDARWLAVSRAEFLEEQVRRNRKLARELEQASSLLQVNRALAEIADRSELCDFFVALVAREIEVRRASLMLLDPDTNRLTIAASRGIADVDPDEVSVAAGEGVAGGVAQSGEAMRVVRSASDDPGLGRAWRSGCGRSFVSSPVSVHGRVIGVINVTDRQGDRTLREADAAYLADLAAEFAVAFERLGRDGREAVRPGAVKSLGLLTRQLVHDLNNVFGAILNWACVALEKTEADAPDLDKLRKYLENVRDDSLRGSKLLERARGKRESDPS